MLTEVTKAGLLVTGYRLQVTVTGDGNRTPIQLSIEPTYNKPCNIAPPEKLHSLHDGVVGVRYRCGGYWLQVTVTGNR